MAVNVTETPNIVRAPYVHNAPTMKCDRYYAENKTHFIYGGYEGIPENLLLNFIVWVVLLILFSILRKIAWDYGRIALVSRNEESDPLRDDTSGYNVYISISKPRSLLQLLVSRSKNLGLEIGWTSLFYGERQDPVAANNLLGSQESMDTNLRMQDKGEEADELPSGTQGFCSWIPAYFRIKDEHIQRKCGKDAIQYLLFQRYLILYTAIICVLSIGIVLPVNFQGNLEGDTQTFGHTTMSNLKTGSPSLWVHAVLAVVFLIIAVYLMRHFSVNLNYEEHEKATRTLMISHIPREKCFKNILLQHFQEAYGEVAPVQDIQFAYNIQRLASLDAKRQLATEGRQNSEIIYRTSGERPLITPYPFGQLCCCCASCGCRKVDAIDFYCAEEKKMKDRCEQEKVHAFQDALGIAFVTFENDRLAARVYMDFKTMCKGVSNPHISSVSRELNVAEWNVSYAPAPDNIYWENLSVGRIWWWVKALVINLFLLVLLFFLSTPTIVMNSLDELNYKKELARSHNILLVQFVPTLLLWTFAATLPLVVYYSDQFIGHWTRSAEHHAVMKKTFTFLLVMVIILPSLGLTSAKAFFEWAITDKNKRIRWGCVFLPGNGAFFVNYVITAAFIGTSLELIRFPELFTYAIRLLLARSAAEKTSVRKSTVWEFQFGMMYAWMLCIFAVIVVYSIPCPLVVPFGLVYLGLKHAVDRYNIYFAYAPSRIDKHIHASAVNFVIVAVILLQFNVVFFTILRQEQMHGITVFSMIALFVTLIIFLGRVFFGWFKGLSPITYKLAKFEASKKDDSETMSLLCDQLRKFRSLQTPQFDEKEQEPSTEDSSLPFVPKILMDDQRERVGDATIPENGEATYGAMTESPEHSPTHNVQDR